MESIADSIRKNRVADIKTEPGLMMPIGVPNNDDIPAGLGSLLYCILLRAAVHRIHEQTPSGLRLDGEGCQFWVPLCDGRRRYGRGTFAYGDTYYVYMAKGALSDGCTKSEYNKAAYVLEVKDMFHENEHIWQYTKAWNDKQNMNVIKSYRRITDTVRRMFIIPVDGGSLNL